MLERITLVLDPTEMDALRTAALAELRRPREQARMILREALGLQGEKKNEGGAMDLDPKRAALTV